MPFGIRARGRKKRQDIQKAGEENRVANAMDPGVRALRPAGTRSHIRGVRNIRKGQHTAQAYQIGQAQDARDEQNLQNAFNREDANKRFARQTAMDAENTRRFNLLRGDRIEAEETRKRDRIEAEETRKNEMDIADRRKKAQSMLPGRATAPAAAGKLAPKTAKSGRTMVKKPSANLDFWISRLAALSPAAAEKLQEKHPATTTQKYTRKFGPFSFGEGEDQIPNPQAGEFVNPQAGLIFSGALDTYAETHPNGTEEDALRYAAEAAGLGVPSKAEEQSNIDALFGPINKAPQKQPEAQQAAPENDSEMRIDPGRIENDSEMRIDPGRIENDSAMAIPRPRLTVGERNKMVPFEAPAAQPPQANTGERNKMDELKAQVQSNIDSWSGIGNRAPAAQPPQQVAGTAAVPQFGPSAQQTRFPSRAPYIGPVPEPVKVAPGSLTAGDIGRAVVGAHPLGMLANGLDAVSGGLSQRPQQQGTAAMLAAQKRLQSGKVPQEQQEPLRKLLTAVNNLLAKQDRTAAEQQLLDQATERLNALYGG